jgi:hypothetical protein
MKTPRLSLEQINALMNMGAIACERCFISYETLVVKMRFADHGSETAYAYFAWDKNRGGFRQTNASLFEQPQVIDAAPAPRITQDGFAPRSTLTLEETKRLEARRAQR